MNIKENLNKIKPIENDIILVLVITFVALVSFGLGRLSAITERKTPVEVSEIGFHTASVGNRISHIEKLFVASKNGTKYHYPWCSGAQRIKESNKIWFATKEEAEKAGYSPASNCKGL